MEKISCRICNVLICTNEIKFHSQTCKNKNESISDLSSLNKKMEVLFQQAKEKINILKLNIKTNNKFLLLFLILNLIYIIRKNSENFLRTKKKGRFSTTIDRNIHEDFLQKNSKIKNNQIKK